MADLCSTSITIYHEDASIIKDLYNLITKWTEKSEENPYGDVSLENIVEKSEIGKPDDYFCSGYVSFMELDDNRINIDEETKYRPAIKLWLRVIDKWAKGASLIYVSEECGCEIYYTNDEDYGNHYVIECMEKWPKESEETFEKNGWSFGDKKDDATKLEAMNLLLLMFPETENNEEYKKLKTDEEKIAMLIRMYEESPFRQCCSIHEWQWIEPQELD